MTITTSIPPRIRLQAEDAGHPFHGNQWTDVPQSVVDFEKSKRDIHDHEEMLVHLGSGETIHTVGKKEAVSISGKDMRKMMDDGNAVMTHNHPYVASLSSSDLAMASKANMKEIRAADSEFVYVAKRPEGGWPDGSRLKSTWTRSFNLQVKGIQSKLDSGEMTVAQANKDVTHAATESTCHKFGIKYERH